MPAIIDSREAAEYLRITAHTLRRLARNGAIPAFRVGGIWRFRQADLEQWASSRQNPSPRQHILVADDDPLVRGFVRLVLEAQGHTVQEAAHGGEAVAHMHQRPADLVFLDLLMPQMNGPQALGAIRDGWPGVPVVILTGHPDSDLMAEILRYGPVTLLRKPVTQAQIIECVQHLCGRPGRLSARPASEASLVRCSSAPDGSGVCLAGRQR